MSNTSSKKTDLPLKIGLTGGIGSGKSLVSVIFRVLGIPVFQADVVAKQLYTRNREVRETLTAMFGSEVYLPDGEVNRSYLASVIFHDAEALAVVNRLIHPLVSAGFGEWSRHQNTPYVLHEAAILFESGAYLGMDDIILVIAPEELRIRRVMDRDNTGREQVLARIRNQWTDKEKEVLSGYVILNDEEHLLTEQIIEIDKKIRSHGQFC